MTHEKTFKLEDGSRIKIRTRLWVDSFREDFEYRTEVFSCEKGKRTFTPDSNIFLEHHEKVKEIETELWQKLKP